MKTTSGIIKTIILLTVLLGVTPSGGWGQVDVVSNLRAQIERNEEHLREAEQLVRATNSIKARAALETARKLHEASKTALLNNNTLLAGRTALRAREAIIQTIAIAKREARLEENSLKAIETATIRHERARSLLDEQGSSDDQPAAKLVEESHHQLQRAKNNVREHMFEVALHLANASIELSDRAIRMLKREQVSPDKVTREIARTDRVLERAGDPQAGNLSQALRDAHELQRGAKRSARDARFRMALNQTKRARALAQRAVAGTSDPEESRDDAERALNLTGRLLEQAYEIAREHGRENVVERLNEAATIQREAQMQFENGNYRRVMRLTLRAREIVKDTVRVIDKPFDETRVKEALAKTDEIIDAVRAALAGGEHEAAAALFERASNRQAAAWEAFESGRTKKALAQTKIARNLAQRALRQLGDD